MKPEIAPGFRKTTRGGHEIIAGPFRARDVELFFSRVKKTDSCWEWTGYTRKGYGAFYVRREGIPAHRFSYTILVGEIPKGLHIDHLCKNTLCVNPAHLEPVTLKENVMRGDGPTAVNARASHCVHGHEFNEANTIIEFRGDNEKRRCRECNKIRCVAYRKKVLAPFIGREVEVTVRIKDSK